MIFFFWVHTASSSHLKNASFALALLFRGNLNVVHPKLTLPHLVVVGKQEKGSNNKKKEEESKKLTFVYGHE